MGEVISSQSVTHAPAPEGAIVTVSSAAARFFMARMAMDADEIPPYATALRETFLRNILLQPEYGLLGGALSIQTTKFASNDWYLEGGTDQERDFMQAGLEYRSIGGFTSLRAKLARDFYSQDKGAFVEVLDMSLPGEEGGKRKPLVPPAVGLAHLDSQLCHLTRDSEWPVVYQNPQTNKRHILHASRVIHLVNDPSTDWTYAGWGTCAVSRVIQRAKIASKQGVLELERLEDLPPGSLMVVNNAHWEDAVKTYDTRQIQKGNTVYRDVMVLESIDPENPASVEVVRFRSLPEDYDPSGSFYLTMLIFALGWGCDVRDFTSFTNAELGTASEAIVKHAKARTSGGGAYLLRVFQEQLNHRFMAGTGVRFVLREQDDEQEAIRAETTSIQAETYGKAYERGGLTREEYRAKLNAIGVLDDEDLIESGEEADITESDAADRQRQEGHTPATLGNPALSGAQDSEIGQAVIADVLAWWATIPGLAPYAPKSLDEIADIPTGNGDPDSLRIIRQATIPEGAREGLSQVAINAFKRDARALTARFSAGEIDLPAWQEESRVLIKRAYVSQAAIGKGGWANVTRSDWGRVGAMLSSRTGGQYLYLDQFARDIQARVTAGEPLSEAQIGARLEMYGDSSRQSLAAADAAYRGIIPSELPALPGDGTTLCLSRCQCKWEYVPAGEGIAQAFWELGIADHCETCIWRSENWNPWGPVQVQNG